jgi:ComF family protein
MNVVDTWLKRIQLTLWPPICVLCGSAGQRNALDLCAPCDADLPLNFPACTICAQPLSGEFVGQPACGACLRRPPRFDLSYCPFRYAYPIDHLVHGIKYRGAVAQGRVLSELLARGVQQTRTAPLPDILLPVPLAQRRFRERGYNQAIELGRYLEKRLAVPMRTDLAIRVRETREQAALDRPERRRNIRDAFAVVRDLPAGHIAIIDDVITTGSTVNELARTLKRAGAQRVEVWAVARAGK